MRARYTNEQMETREIRKPAAGEFAFEITGGALCLDFTNTLGDRAAERTNEHLHSFADLVAWSRQAGAVTPSQAARLLREAGRSPAAARAALRKAVVVRELIHRVIAGGAQAPDLERFNEEVSLVLANLRLRREGRGYVWGWSEGHGKTDLGRMLWPVLRSAAELLTSGELPRVRVCAEPTCGWLFLDRSKNGSRRWCDMKVCGNRAKARKFYKKSRAA